MMRCIFLLLALVAVAAGQILPQIMAITNAAMPAADWINGDYSVSAYTPETADLAPRSLATMWGTDLADATVSTTPPWKSTLGGTEVHLVPANPTVPICPLGGASCDLIAPLLYVSPTQINFLVPDDGNADCAPETCVPITYRVVLVRDGQRIGPSADGGDGWNWPAVMIDDWYYTLGNYNIVFQVGYDCIYSFSQSSTDPAICGLSWTQGQAREPLGAITDAITGELISSGNPVHQGQLITLWMTALFGGVTLNSTTGLMTANPFWPEGDLSFNSSRFVLYLSQLGLLIGELYATPIWAGESPQFVGLDQVNLTFPVCSANSRFATVEQRFDASWNYLTSTSIVEMYLPVLVRPGDPDCSSPL
jgi:hypothetical protein